MFPQVTIIGREIAIYPLSLLVVLVLGFFLFWRACRHELIEAEVAFDISIIGAVGALLGGRMLEFAVKFEQYGWELEKLIFANAYPGFDFYGAILGAGVAVFLFAKQAKLAPLLVFDLAAAPLVFSQAAVSLAKYFFLWQDLVWLLYAAFNFIIFWTMKRLAKRKRHGGFFLGFYLVTLAVLDIGLFFKRAQFTLVSGVPYEFVVPIVILQVTLVVWYTLSGRQIIADLKDFFAFFLLAVLRIRRIIGDANEAGRLSRSVVLAPYWFLRSMVALLKLVGREIYLGIVDFLVVVGVRR